MRASQLILRGLTFYWRTHAAVVLGVATAVAVLTGALLVGDSVRGSLRALMLDRLGRTDEVVATAGLFTEQLADRITGDAGFTSAFDRITPLVMARGMVTNQDSGRRAGDVAVYGVDDRFWRFHTVSQSGPEARDAFISESLAAQLQADGDSSLIVRLQRPTDVPLESLHGRKDDLGRTLRLTVSAVLARESLGEFSLVPSQGEVRAVFVPLRRLQEELEIGGRVNAMLVARKPGVAPSDRLASLVRRHATLEDLGITLTDAADSRTLIIGSAAGLLDDAQVTAARQAAAQEAGVPEPVFTYLANSLRIGDRDVPYSLVTARELPPALPGEQEAIVLSRWAAEDLRAAVGDRLSMDYYVWEEPGRLVTKSATFTVARIAPIAEFTRDLAPAYPGISDSPTLDDWDPPFPIDLRRVRPADEQYWKDYRTTPKAYIALETGRRLWGSRYGSLTSVRVPFPDADAMSRARGRIETALAASLDPLASGLTVRDVRAAGLDASKGATDFGEYFVYFSFFLVASALLLALLFFKLGVEQRVREVGLLRAVGFGPAQVRRLFLLEGLLLSCAGGAVGVAAGIGYAALLMWALRTWWVDAVGTTSLQLHVTGLSLALGLAGGVAVALVCIWWTLRSLGRVSERSLLMGELTDGALPVDARTAGRPARLVALLLLGIGLALLGASAAGVVPAAGAFFGAGFALMTAALVGFLVMSRARPRAALGAHGWPALLRLGMRYASMHPGRSVLATAVIASATFILISVDAFRRDEATVEAGRQTGVGGYGVVVDVLVPIAHDPNTDEGRNALNLFEIGEDVRIEPLRVRPGDDASCLNLYQPTNPRIVAPSDAFVREGRFVFSASLAETDAERANPWLLLEKETGDGSIPVIADANSMTYVLHKALGDEIVIENGGAPLRLRLVASLRDSIFQGDLVMSSGRFVRAFPGEQGYRRLLVETPSRQAARVVQVMEEALADSGADALTTGERLAQFHQVENTYLSTFQTLGGLGLLLGTVGLAAVLLRNVLERRRELALLAAVGYRTGHVMVIILAENTLLLAAGLATGALAAALAIAPALAERGGGFPLAGSRALLLFVILTAGLLSSLFAIRAATRGPLLAALRSE